jgi:ribosome-associated protein
MAPEHPSQALPGLSRDLLVRAGIPITLGQFVKLAGLAGSGGEAKQAVGAGRVRVNGEVETRRGRQLADGDTVELAGRSVTVVADTAAGP